MNQSLPAPSQPPSQPPVVIQTAPSNGLGVAGFVTSLVSLLFLCGFLSPVSLLMSVIALFKKPRGFAIAGTIISSIQVLLILLIGVGPILAVIGLGLSMEKEQTERYEANRVEILETLRTTNDYQEIQQIESDFPLVKDEELEKAIEAAEERVPDPNPNTFGQGSNDDRDLIPDQD